MESLSDENKNGINDADFDSILSAALPAPPDKIVAGITPFKKAMKRVAVGLALSMLFLNLLNFLVLGFLSVIGFVLQLLGFRTLRRENKWFRACYILAYLKLLLLFLSLSLDATVYRKTFFGQPLSPYLFAASAILAFIQFVCLWRALKAVKAKAGQSAKAGPAAALIIWSLLYVVLGGIGLDGVLVCLLMILAYFLILLALYEMCFELDKAGYVIQAAPVGIPNMALVCCFIAILMAGLLCGFAFGGSYKMNWLPKETEETQEITEIKSHLLGLGFPAEVLNDLNDEEIADCKDALRVVVDISDKPVNKGREVVEKDGDTESRYTVYDTKELRMTAVAVELPGERVTWKIFHHFCWLIDPGFKGTECLRLLPESLYNYNWEKVSEVTGRILYTMNGADYCAPYFELGPKLYIGLFTFNTEDIFADFSFPKDGENKRGYIVYTIVREDEEQYMEEFIEYIVDSRVDYTHQTGRLQYPVKTAAEHSLKNPWAYRRAFRTVEDVLHFYNVGDEIRAVKAD